MLRHTLFLGLLAPLIAAATGDTYVSGRSKDFPKGAGAENLVIRPSGDALVAVGTSPKIYQVAPAPNALPKLVHEFPNALGTSSISHGPEPDVYFAITGNYSYQAKAPTPASYHIHRVSFGASGQAEVKELAALPAIAQPNGMIHVPGTPYVLIADCNAGFIFRLNTKTLELVRYFDHPLLKPQAAGSFGYAFGVNGLKLTNGFLYFSNTNQQLVARIRATGREPCLEGSPEVIATQAPVDDFVVDSRNGDLFLAFNLANGLGYVAHGANDTTPKTILGGGNSTDLLGPTAARWAKGAEGKQLLLSVTGGFAQYVAQNYTGGGGVVSVRIGEHL